MHIQVNYHRPQGRWLLSCRLKSALPWFRTPEFVEKIRLQSRQESLPDEILHEFRWQERIPATSGKIFADYMFYKKI